MNAFDELKLFVYESSLSSEMIEEMIDLMESCDEEDLQEVCESVEALVTEANAYNKLMNKYKYDYEKNKKRAELYTDLSNPYGSMDYAKKVKNTINDAKDKANQSGYLAACRDLGDVRIYDKHGVPPKNRQAAREQKQRWMEMHGNSRYLKTPEETFKAGRYLDAQKKLNEIDKKYKR